MQALADWMQVKSWNEEGEDGGEEEALRALAEFDKRCDSPGAIYLQASLAEALSPVPCCACTDAAGGIFVNIRNPARARPFAFCPRHLGLAFHAVRASMVAS